MPAVDNKIIKAAKKPPKIVRDEQNRPVRKSDEKESFLSGLRKSFLVKKADGGANLKNVKMIESQKPNRPIRQPKKEKNKKEQ